MEINIGDILTGTVYFDCPIHINDDKSFNIKECGGGKVELTGFVEGKETIRIREAKRVAKEAEAAAEDVARVE